MRGGPLAAALELERRLSTRAAQRVLALPDGWAVRHDGLPEVHALNAVVLRGPVAAGEVVAIADRALGDARHRLVVVLDDAGGERVAAPLEARGWQRRRTLYMALAGDALAAGRPRSALGGSALGGSDPRVRELTEPELAAIELDAYREDNVGPDASPGLPRALASAQAALRAGTAWRGFGATATGGGDQLRCTATLFLEPDVDGRRVALIDQVATLREHRGQGLARATLSAALAAAGWGADLVAVPCDADDWPQLMYASLGFAPIGRTWAFTKMVR